MSLFGRSVACGGDRAARQQAIPGGFSERRCNEADEGLEKRGENRADSGIVIMFVAWALLVVGTKNEEMERRKRRKNHGRRPVGSSFWLFVEMDAATRPHVRRWADGRTDGRTVATRLNGKREKGKGTAATLDLCGRALAVCLDRFCDSRNETVRQAHHRRDDR